MRKLVVIAAILFASACIDDGVDGSQSGLPSEKSADVQDPSTTPEVEFISTPRQRDPNNGTPAPICAMLPDDDSACAHACDSDALAQYVPEEIGRAHV